MKCSNQSFISSTFWTDRLGYVAALATLKEMNRIKSWKKINIIGKKLKKGIKKVAEKNSIKIKFKGLDTLISFEIKSQNSKLIYDFITYKMLKYGFLARNSIYVSISHTDKIINRYLYYLDKVFGEINKNSLNYLKNQIKKK